MTVLVVSVAFVNEILLIVRRGFTPGQGIPYLVPPNLCIIKELFLLFNSPPQLISPTSICAFLTALHSGTPEQWLSKAPQEQYTHFGELWVWPSDEVSEDFRNISKALQGIVRMADVIWRTCAIWRMV